jgi:hypothetical protein
MIGADKLWNMILEGGKDLSDRLREAGRAAFFEPEAYDPRAPLEAATLVTGGRMPFAAAGEAGVGGGRLTQSALKEVRGAEASDPGYVYHATNSERAADIAESGKLKTHKPHEFTDQDVWPDQSTEKRNYFTPTAEHTWQFAPEEGKPTLLRIKRDAHAFKTESTGDLYSTKPVSASKIEILTEEGWKPLLAAEPKTATLGIGGGRTIQPSLQHGLSQVKLPKPVEEMTATYKGTPKPSKIITPADLQGGHIFPAIGDRSIAGRQLTGVGGERLGTPTKLQGGPGYMSEQAGRGSGSIWAAGGGIPTRLENLARKIEQETGEPAYMAYSAMSHRSVDAAHHMSDTLSEMLKTAKITKKDAAAFDKEMRTSTTKSAGPVKDWPGVQSKNLRQYLRDAGMGVRNKFAQTMDKQSYQEAGFPSVAEARFAVTDPRLLHEPIGASGLEIGRPTLSRLPSEHETYSTGMSGEHMGGFGASVPREHMFMDRFADIAASRSPERKFAMSLPVQEANQQWVDTLSTFLRDHRGIPLSVTAAMSLPELVELAERETTRNR